MNVDRMNMDEMVRMNTNRISHVDMEIDGHSSINTTLMNEALVNSQIQWQPKRRRTNQENNNVNFKSLGQMITVLSDSGSSPCFTDRLSMSDNGSENCNSNKVNFSPKPTKLDTNINTNTSGETVHEQNNDTLQGKKPRRRRSFKRKFHGISLKDKDDNENESEEMKLDYLDVGLIVSMAIIFPKMIGGYGGDKIIRACVGQIASDRWNLKLKEQKNKIDIVIRENLEWPEKLKEEKKKKMLDAHVKLHYQAMPWKDCDWVKSLH